MLNASVAEAPTSPARPTLILETALLQAALAMVPAARDWAVFNGVRLLRLGCRVDVVVVTPGAVLALRIAVDATRFNAADRLAIEGAALDLADFHAGCDRMPVVPILVVPNGARPRGTRPLPLAGASSVIETTRLLLPGLLQDIAAGFPTDPAPRRRISGTRRPIARCRPWSRRPVCSMRDMTSSR